jgi:pimeloyl-ACP methyl ester carboxylesterase
MHSLLPVESINESRRKLLLIYIHGFVGNETSFKSFPAHVHNIITLTLAESHVVHTKIYPRYKSRRAIDFARDDFSNWYEYASSYWTFINRRRLFPNESPTTDVILLGHSLGGILASEVALLPTHSPKSPEMRQHRILGVIGFDTPFLGMHPGVITTGIGSLFRSAPEMPEPKNPEENGLSPVASTSASLLSPSDSNVSDPFSAQPTGPNFNPAFANDVIWNPSQKYWESGLHFVQKHKDGLFKASKQYVMSHLEFGGCLADYPGLKNRYDHMRALEDIDELAQHRDAQGRPYRRVRFVNYYSASTGRPKPPKRSESATLTLQTTLSTETQDMSLTTSKATEGRSSGVATPSTGPRLSLEEDTEGGFVSKPLDEMEEIEPRPMDHSDVEEAAPEHQELTLDGSLEDKTAEAPQSLNAADSNEAARPEDVSEADSLPPVPRLPHPPAPFDASRYTAKDTLRIAEKEHARQTKAYERAKKDREKTIREREKMLQKRERLLVKEQEKKEKALAKEQEKQAKLVKKNQDIEEKERLKRSTTLNPETYDKQLQREAELNGISEKQMVRTKKRDRKFCALPTKDPKTGLRDPVWIRVYMEGVDEVVAHTTLFSGLGDAYEKLVGDTAGRIEEWVREDHTKRVVLGEEPNVD